MWAVRVSVWLSRQTSEDSLGETIGMSGVGAPKAGNGTIGNELWLMDNARSGCGRNPLFLRCELCDDRRVARVSQLIRFD